MTTKSLAIALLAVALGLSSFVAEAAPKKKHHPEPVNPDKVAPPTDDPFVGLQPFIQNLDQLLALDRNGDKSFDAFADQASGRLLIIRSELTGQRVGAEAAAYPRIDAAIVTCDALTHALEERQAFLAQYNAAKTVKGPTNLNLRRADSPDPIQYDRELRENKQARIEAQKTENAMNAASRNRWTQRSIQLHQIIQADYARIPAPAKAS